MAAKTWSPAELRAMIASLRALWPLAFGAEYEPRPLALRVGRAILEGRPPGMSKRDVKAAIAAHVGSDLYLKALIREGSRRVNLDGTDGGEVAAAHRAYATKKLEQRMAMRRAAAIQKQEAMP
jgi:sRNA-binding protein